MNYQLLSIINWLEQHQLPCFIKKITGFDCPGCGFQRSSIELLKGNMGESFRIYPALIPILLLFVVLGLHLLKKLPNGVWILKFTYIFTAIIILISYIHKLINY
ncbi:MAG: DUF2752 domain-containing protein [Ferruginibacter sp.]|nr:DUF2752 domain-containing protein [Ferruginibacter sp.]